MRNSVFPYKVLPQDLILEVNSIQLSGGVTGDLSKINVPKDIIDEELGRIDLYLLDNQKWVEVSLNLFVELPAGLWEEAESLTDELKLTAIVNCSKSNLRKGFPLSRADEKSGRWIGSISIDRREVLGKVEVMGVLHGRKNDRDARFFAESNIIKFYFSESDSFDIHGALPVKWVSFSTSDDYPALKDYADEVYFLEASGNEPVVLLNSDIDGLRTVFLERPRPKGTRLALLETLKTSIAKSVWLSLFQIALGDISNSQEGEDITWPNIPWQENVLKKILPYVYPRSDEDGLLINLQNDIQASNYKTIISSALAGINKNIIHEGQSVRRAISQVDPINL